VPQKKRPYSPKRVFPWNNCFINNPIGFRLHGATEPKNKRRRGKMKAMLKKWLPKVAVVVAGVIVATELAPAYMQLREKIKSATKGA
jgi:hypothetical protein